MVYRLRRLGTLLLLRSYRLLAASSDLIGSGAFHLLSILQPRQLRYVLHMLITCCIRSFVSQSMFLTGVAKGLITPIPQGALLLYALSGTRSYCIVFGLSQPYGFSGYTLPLSSVRPTIGASFLHEVRESCYRWFGKRYAYLISGFSSLMIQVG